MDTLNTSLNASDLHDILLKLSLTALRIRLWANSLVIIFAISGVISNSFLLWTIYQSKSLHTKGFVLIAINGGVDLVLGFSYGVTSAKRIYRYITKAGEVMSQWHCACEVMPILFTQSMSLSMAGVLVIDRSLAIFRPIPYKQSSTRRHIAYLISLVLTCTSIQFFVHVYDSYHTPPYPTIFSCGMDDSLSSEMLVGLTGVKAAFAALIVSMNCVLAIVMKLKKNKVQPNSSSADGSKDGRAFRSMAMTAMLHAIVHLGGRLFIVTAPGIFDDIGRALANRYIRDLTVISAGINCYILFAMSSEFRKATMQLVRSTSESMKYRGAAA